LSASRAYVTEIFANAARARIVSRARWLFCPMTW
jgi:hypothetical protein